MRSQNINKQTDAKNEAEYDEYSVTDEVTSYFNIFKCVGNILNRLYMTYEQECMVTTKDKYFEKMLETLVKHNNRQHLPLSNDNLQQAVSKVMRETKEKDCNAYHDANNVTMETFCQSYVTTNTQRKNTRVDPYL